MSVPTPPEHHLTLNRLATIARLVAGAAHEVNNALQVIGGSAELLQNRTDLPEPVQKTLSRIRDQAARAASAMTGVVALSRAQPDGATYLVDMCDIATRAVELRRYSIGRADLTVQLDVPSAPQLVAGHRLHLLQAALNMIQNAEQALAPRRAGRIRVEVVEDGDHVVLAGGRRRPRRAGRGCRTHLPAVRHSSPRPESTGLGLSVGARDCRGPPRVRSISRPCRKAPRSACAFPRRRRRRRFQAARAGSRRPPRLRRSRFSDIQPLQLVDEGGAAQMQQPRRLPLVAARLLQAAQDQVAFELRHDRREVNALVGYGDRGTTDVAVPWRMSTGSDSAGSRCRARSSSPEYSMAFSN
jgi:hypothetical protein